MTTDHTTTDDPDRAGTDDTDMPSEPGVERGPADTVVPAVPAPTADRKSSRIRRLVSPLVVLGIFAVFSVGLAAALYFTEQLPDIQTDDAAGRSAVKAASQGATAVLSYTPATLTSDLAAAKSHLTGEFLAYYSKFSDEVLGPTAKQKQITTKATVVQAALSELHPDFAKVLVFVNQMSQAKGKPFVVQASSVIVSLTKSHGTWLISAFEPV